MRLDFVKGLNWFDRDTVRKRPMLTNIPTHECISNYTRIFFLFLDDPSCLFDSTINDVGLVGCRLCLIDQILQGFLPSPMSLFSNF